uniref:Uncharacterized protein n=1 Tax=Magallana gigas TaxID=29159 RepID=A0A8W8NVK5_MAGGI
MEYTGAEREFGNFQMNPNDEVPTEISNSDEELLNSFDPTVPELKKMEKEVKKPAYSELPQPETPVEGIKNRRFKNVTEEQLKNYHDSHQSSSIKKNTVWGMKIFQGGMGSMEMNPMAAMLCGLGGMVKRSTLKTNTADGGRSRRRNTDFTVGGRRDPVRVDLFSDTFTPVKSHITGNSVAIGTSGSVKDAVSQKEKAFDINYNYMFHKQRTVNPPPSRSSAMLINPLVSLKCGHIIAFCPLAIPPPDPFKSARSKTENIRQFNYQEPRNSNTMKNAPLDITFQTKNTQSATNTLEKTLPSASSNKQVGSASPWNTPVAVQNNLNTWPGSNLVPTTTVSPPTVTSVPQIATTDSFFGLTPHDAAGQMSHMGFLQNPMPTQTQAGFGSTGMNNMFDMGMGSFGLGGLGLGQTTMMHGVGSVGGSGNMGGFGPAAIGSTAGAAGGPSQFNQMLSNGANTDMLFASIGLIPDQIADIMGGTSTSAARMPMDIKMKAIAMRQTGMTPDQIADNLGDVMQARRAQMKMASRMSMMGSMGTMGIGARALPGMK